MQSDFKPIHLQKANEILSQQLKAVEIQTGISKGDQKETLSKPSLWKKFLNLFKPSE